MIRIIESKPNKCLKIKNVNMMRPLLPEAEFTWKRIPGAQFTQKKILSEYKNGRRGRS